MLFYILVVVVGTCTSKVVSQSSGTLVGPRARGMGSIRPLLLNKVSLSRTVCKRISRC